MPDHYTQLLEWRRAEAAARGLAKLPHDFYSATQAYLAELRRTFEVELRENPSGKKGDIARQTFGRATQVARDVIEARMTKVLSQAFQSSVGGSRDLANALPEERPLYESLMTVLRGHRSSLAPYLESTGPATPVLPPGTAVPPPPTPPAGSSVPAHGLSVESPGPAAALVRILKDGRPIEVGTETIDLRKEDVLSLPPETARLLVEAKVAELIIPAQPKPVT